jgi:hypothetical protein
MRKGRGEAPRYWCSTWNTSFLANVGTDLLGTATYGDFGDA